MSPQTISRPISTGNILRYFTGCPCGRAWETDHPLHEIPDHHHNEPEAAAA
jgi:hypothetical protein